MIEAPQPNDRQAPVIGYDAWKEAVARLVNEQNKKRDLLQNVGYAVPPDQQGATMVSGLFDKRVSECVEFFGTRFPGAPIVKVTFDKEPALDTLGWQAAGMSVNSKPVLSILNQAGDNQGWQGVIEVDLSGKSKTDAAVGSNPSFAYFQRRMARGKLPGLLVIDGYGRQAIERGFFMQQLFEKTHGLTVLIRYAKEQRRLDAGYGSPWGEMTYVGYTDSHEFVDGTANHVSSPIMFDEKRFRSVYAAITQGLDQLVQGSKVVVKGSFHLGKTTALQALASLAPPNMSVGELTEGGELWVFGNRGAHGDQSKLERIVIVNEAGRQGAETVIKPLEENHLVLRVYPSDGKPPQGYAVIEMK